MEKSRLPLFRRKNKGTSNNTTTKNSKTSDAAKQNGHDNGSSKREKGQGLQSIVIGNRGSKEAKKDRKNESTVRERDSGHGSVIVQDDSAKKRSLKSQTVSQKSAQQGDSRRSHDASSVGKVGVASVLRKRHDSRGNEPGQPVEPHFTKAVQQQVYDHAQAQYGASNQQQVYNHTNSQYGASNQQQVYQHRVSSSGSKVRTSTRHIHDEARRDRESSRDIIAADGQFQSVPVNSEGLLLLHNKSSVDPQVSSISRDSSFTELGGYGHTGEGVHPTPGHMFTSGDNTAVQGGPHAVSASYLDQFRKYYEYDVTGRCLPDDSGDGKSPSDPDSSPHHDYEDIDLIMSGVYPANRNTTSHQRTYADQGRIHTPNTSSSQDRFPRRSDGQDQGPLIRTQGLYDRGPLPPPPVPPHSSAYYQHPAATGRDKNPDPTSYNKTSAPPHLPNSTSPSHSSNHLANQHHQQQPLARGHINNPSSRSIGRSHAHTPRLGLYKHSASAEGFVQRESTGQQNSGQQSSGQHLLPASQSGLAWTTNSREDYEPLIGSQGNRWQSEECANSGVSARVDTDHPGRPSASVQYRDSINQLNNTTGNVQVGVSNQKTSGQRANIPKATDQIGSDGVKIQSNYGSQSSYEITAAIAGNGYTPVSPVNQGFHGEGLRMNSFNDHILAVRSCYNNVQEESTPPDSPLDIVIPPPTGSLNSPRKFSHFTYSTNQQVNRDSPKLLQNPYSSSTHQQEGVIGNNFDGNRTVTMQDMVAMYNKKNGDYQATESMYDQVPPPAGYDVNHKQNLLSEGYSPVISQYKDNYDLSCNSLSGGDRTATPSYGYIYNTEIQPQYLSEKELQTHQKYGTAIYSSKVNQGTGGGHVTEPSPPYTPILSGPQQTCSSAGQNSPRTVMQGFYALYNSPSGGERPLVTQSPLFGRKHSFPSPSCGIRMAEMRARAQRRWSDPKSPNYAAMAMDRNTPSPTGSSGSGSVHSYQSNLQEDSMTTIREEAGCHGNRKTGASSPSPRKHGSSSRYEKLNPEELRDSGIPEIKRQSAEASWSQTNQCSLSSRKRYPSEPSAKQAQPQHHHSGNTSQYDSLQTVKCAHSTQSLRLDSRVEANHNTIQDGCTQRLVTSDLSAGHQSVPDKVTTAAPVELQTLATQCNEGENGRPSEGPIKLANGLITQSLTELTHKETSTSKGDDATTLAGIKGKSPQISTMEDQQQRQDHMSPCNKGVCDTDRGGVDNNKGTVETVTLLCSSEGLVADSSVTVESEGISVVDEDDIDQTKSQEDVAELLPEESRRSEGTIDEGNEVNVSLKSPNKEATENPSPQGSNKSLSSSPTESICVEDKLIEVHQNNGAKSKSHVKTETTSGFKAPGKSGISKLRPPSSIMVNNSKQGGGVGVKTDQSSGKAALKSHLKEKGSSPNKPLPVNVKKGEIISPSTPHGLREPASGGLNVNSKEANSAVKSTQITSKQLKSGEGTSVKSTKTGAGASKLKAASHIKVKGHKTGETSGIPQHRKTTREDVCQPSSCTDRNTGIGLSSKQENSSLHSESNQEEESHNIAVKCHKKSVSSRDDRFKSQTNKSLTESDDSLVMVLGLSQKSVKTSAGKCHQRAASYSSISSCDPMSSLPSSPYSSQLSIDSISSDTFEYDLPSSKATGVFNPSVKSIMQNNDKSFTTQCDTSEEQYDLRDNTSDNISNISLSQDCHSDNNKDSSARNNVNKSGKLSDEKVCDESVVNCDKDKSKASGPGNKEAGKKPEKNKFERRGSASGIPLTRGFGFKGGSSSPKVNKRMSSSTSSESNVSLSSVSGIAVRAKSYERGETETRPTGGDASSPSRNHGNKVSQLKKPMGKGKFGPKVEKQQYTRKEGSTGGAIVASKSKPRSSSAGRYVKPSDPSGEEGDQTEPHQSQNIPVALSFSRSNSSESNASSQSSVKGCPVSPTESNKTGIPMGAFSSRKSTDSPSKLRAPKPSKLMKPTAVRETNTSKDQSSPSKIVKSTPSQADHKPKVTTKTSGSVLEGNGAYCLESKDNSCNKTAGESTTTNCHSSNSQRQINSQGGAKPVKRENTKASSIATMIDNKTKASAGENTKPTTFSPHQVMEHTSHTTTETQTLTQEIVTQVSCERGAEAVITSEEKCERSEEPSNPRAALPRSEGGGGSPGAEMMASQAPNHLSASKSFLDESGNPCPSPTSHAHVLETACFNSNKGDKRKQAGDAASAYNDVTGDGNTRLLSPPERPEEGLMDAGLEVPGCEHLTSSSSSPSTTGSDRPRNKPQSTGNLQSPLEPTIKGESDTSNLFSGVLLQDDGGEGGVSVTGLCDSDKPLICPPPTRDRGITGEMPRKWQANIGGEVDLSGEEVAPFSHNSSLMEGNHTAVNRLQQQDSRVGNGTVSNNRPQLGNGTPLKGPLNRYGMAQKRGQLPLNGDRMTETPKSPHEPLIEEPDKPQEPSGEGKTVRNLTETAINNKSALLKPQTPVHPFLVRPYASLRKNKSPEVTLSRGQCGSVSIKGSLPVHPENTDCKDLNQSQGCDSNRVIKEVLKPQSESPSVNNSRERSSQTSQPREVRESAPDCVKSTTQLSRAPSSPKSSTPETSLTMKQPARPQSPINHSRLITRAANGCEPLQAPASQFGGSEASGSCPCGSAESPLNDPDAAGKWPASSHLEEGVRSAGTGPETGLCPHETQHTLPRCQFVEHDPARNCQVLPQQIGSINGTSSLGAVSINCDSNGDKRGQRGVREEPDCIQGGEGGGDGANQSQGYSNNQSERNVKTEADMREKETGRNKQDGRNTGDNDREKRGPAERNTILTSSGGSGNNSKPSVLVSSTKTHNKGPAEQFHVRCPAVGSRGVNQGEETYEGDDEAHKGYFIDPVNTSPRIEDTNVAQIQDNEKPETYNNNNKKQQNATTPNFINSTGLLEKENKSSLSENQTVDPMSSESYPSLHPQRHPVSSEGRSGCKEKEEIPAREKTGAEGPCPSANGVQARDSFCGQRGAKVVTPSRSRRMEDDSTETGGWMRPDSRVTKSGPPHKTGAHKSQARILPDKQICKKASLISKLGKYNKIHSSSTAGTNSDSFVNSKDGRNESSLEAAPSTSCLQTTEPLKRVVLSNTGDLSEGSEGINEDASESFHIMTENHSPREQANTDKSPGEPVKYDEQGCFYGNQKANIQQQYDSYFVLNDQNSGRYMTFPSEPFSPKQRKVRKTGGISRNEPFEMKDQYIEDSYFGETSFTSETLLGPSTTTTVLDPTLSPHSQRLITQQQNGENMLNSLKLSESGYDSWKSQGSSSTACDPVSDNEVGQVKGEGQEVTENLGQDPQDDNASLSSSCSDSESINGMSTESVVTMKTVRECGGETTSGSNDEDSNKVTIVTEHPCFEEKECSGNRLLLGLKKVEVKSKLSGSRSSSESTLATDAIKYLEWDTTYDNSLLAHNNKDMSSIEDLLESAELFSRVRDTSDSMEYLVCEYDDYSDHNFDSGSMRKRLNFSGSDFALALHSMSKSPSEENVLDDCRSAAAATLLLQQGKNTLSSLSQGSLCLHNSSKLPSSSGTLADDNKIYGLTQAALSSLNSGSKVRHQYSGRESVNETTEDWETTCGCQEKEVIQSAGGHNNYSHREATDLVQAAAKWSVNAHNNSSSSSHIARDLLRDDSQGPTYRSPVCVVETTTASGNNASNSDLIAHHSPQIGEGSRNANSQRCEGGGFSERIVSRGDEEVLMGESGGDVHEEGINQGQEAGSGLYRDLSRADHLNQGQLDQCRQENSPEQSGDNCSRELRSNQLTAGANEKIQSHAEALIDRRMNENRGCGADKWGSNAQSEMMTSDPERKTNPSQRNLLPHSLMYNKQSSNSNSNSNIKAKTALFESGVTFLNERRKQLFQSRHGDQYSPRKADLSSPPPHSSLNLERARTGAQQKANCHDANPSPHTPLSPTVNGQTAGNGGEIAFMVTGERVRKDEGRDGENSEDRNAGNRRFSSGLLDYREKLLKHKGSKPEKSRSKSHGDEPSSVKQTTNSSHKVPSERKLGQVTEENRSGEESNCDMVSGRTDAYKESRESSSNAANSSQEAKCPELSTQERPRSLNIPARLSSGSSDLKIATRLFMEVSPPNDVFDSVPQEDVHAKSGNMMTQGAPVVTPESASYPTRHQAVMSRQLSHEEYLKTRRANQAQNKLSPRYQTSPVNTSVSPTTTMATTTTTQIPMFELRNGTLVSRNRPQKAGRGNDREREEKVTAEQSSGDDHKESGNQSTQRQTEHQSNYSSQETMATVVEDIQGCQESIQGPPTRFSTTQIPWGQKRGSGAKVMEKLKLFQGRHKSPEDQPKFSWSQLKFRKFNPVNSSRQWLDPLGDVQTSEYITNKDSQALYGH